MKETKVEDAKCKGLSERESARARRGARFLVLRLSVKERFLVLSLAEVARLARKTIQDAN